MKIIRPSLALPYLPDPPTSNSSNPQFSAGHNGGVSVALATSRSEHWMLRVLVHLVGHRARPSVAWQVAVVLATTGRARRCPAGSTNVGRPAFTRPPRIRRLNQLRSLRREAATLRGSDEETITCRAPADSMTRSTHLCAAHFPATYTISEIRRQLTRSWKAEVDIHLLLLRQPWKKHNLEDTIGNYLSDYWCGRNNSASGSYDEY